MSAASPGSGEEERLVALYRKGDRLTTALALAATGKMLKYSKLLEKNPRWEEVLAIG
jgi:hypothetical protein